MKNIRMKKSIKMKKKYINEKYKRTNRNQNCTNKEYVNEKK